MALDGLFLMTAEEEFGAIGHVPGRAGAVTA